MRLRFFQRIISKAVLPVAFVGVRSVVAGPTPMRIPCGEFDECDRYSEFCDIEAGSCVKFNCKDNCQIYQADSARWCADNCQLGKPKRTTAYTTDTSPTTAGPTDFGHEDAIWNWTFVGTGAGLIGLLLFVVFVIVMIWVVRRQLRRAKPQAETDSVSGSRESYQPEPAVSPYSCAQPEYNDADQLTHAILEECHHHGQPSETDQLLTIRTQIKEISGCVPPDLERSDSALGSSNRSSQRSCKLHSDETATNSLNETTV